MKRYSYNRLEQWIFIFHITRCSKAFGKIYNTLFSELFDFVSKHAKNLREASLIVQEVFAEIHANFDTIDSVHSLKRQLYSLAKMKCGISMYTPKYANQKKTYSGRAMLSRSYTVKTSNDILHKIFNAPTSINKRKASSKTNLAMGGIPFRHRRIGA